MAQYRFLTDHYIGNAIFPAGTTASTADVPGGTLPVNWVPSGAVDPLDDFAIQAFWSVGPQNLPLIRSQWTFVAPPSVYWQPFNLALFQYQLTGAGAALGPKCAGTVLGNRP